MNWAALLDTMRPREFFDGKGSNRAAGELRDEFERDYGRVIFSTPVRRLQDKTQVFPLEPLDSVRTRLTHSIEVSSVARNLGRQAGEWLAAQGHLTDASNQVRGIETLAATCAVLHDLGNPPFGHAGEEAIQGWFARHVRDDDQFKKAFPDKTAQEAQDFAHWEGNAQTLRLLAKLQVMRDMHGLNTTFATLSAARKYVGPSNRLAADRHEMSKPGYFKTETELIKAIQERTGTGEARHPIAYLVEVADDAVYAFVDLEDGVRKHLIAWQEVRDRLVELVDGDREILDKALLSAEVSAGDSSDHVVYAEAMAQSFRTFAIFQAVTAALEVFKVRYSEIIEGRYHGELLQDELCRARSMVRAAKRLARGRVYNSPAVLRLEIMGREVIQRLLDFFWEGALVGPVSDTKTFPNRLYALTSSNYRRVFEAALKRGEASEFYLRVQLVTDQLAGMTDTFAFNLHRELTGR